MPNDGAGPVNIRDARDADLPAIEALLAGSGLPLDGVREALGTFLVAEAGGILVGVAGVEERGSHGLLRSIAVDQDSRGRGVGRELVQRAIESAEARGLEALCLLTTTAERYFPHFGFTLATRESVPEALRQTAEFQGACPASATVMVRASGAAGRRRS
jgi:amino-acid N-acetyltransferase